MKKILLILLNLFVALNISAQFYPSSFMPSNFDLSGVWIKELVQDGNTRFGAYFLFDKDLFYYYNSQAGGPAMWAGKFVINAGKITFVIQKHLGLLMPEEKIAIYNAFVLKDDDNGDVVGISFSYGLTLEAPEFFKPSHFK
jgi:hypothetical protein